MIRFVIIAAVFMSFFSNLESQTIQNSQLNVTASTCQWVGSVEVTKIFFGWKETISGTVRYEMTGSDYAGDTYNLNACNLTWSASGTYSECTVQGTSLNYTVVGDSQVIGYLRIEKSGEYYGYVILNDDRDSLVTILCPGWPYISPSNTNETDIGVNSIPFFIQNDLIVGEHTESEPQPGGVDLYHYWKWNLHKESAGETKLSVEAAAYDNWAPEAARNEVEGIGKDVGNVLTFKARLIESDGTTACATADSFTFQLKNVSIEPGVCLNYPRAEVAETDYDLHFKQELNTPTDVMSSDRLKLRTLEGREATATVASFDWGGYGTLIVTAYMQGGKTIKGSLNGHPEITDILIPKRSPDSKIADRWKQDHDVLSLADEDDSEDKPVGDGDLGDGFTLYEEYRGFSVKGEHTVGDPKTKDLFIFSDSDDFLPGIQLFKALTSFNVHTQLYGFDEFDRSVRVMNFNHSDAPHSVDQHGLWIKPDDGRGFSFTTLGPPKLADSVNISSGAYGFRTITRGTSREITNELNATVAHELGHAVRIEHHGDADTKRTYSTHLTFNTTTESFDIEFSETGHTGFVIPKWENDRLFTQSLLGEKYVAVWGGEHCGFEDCIMRYDCAYLYIPGPGATSDIRYIVRGDERTGIMLCDTKEDSPLGVNYPTRQPRPRYGGAVNGRCKYQICVNDKYH